MSTKALPIKDPSRGDLRLNKPNQSLIMKPEKGKLASNGLKLHLALLYISQKQLMLHEAIPSANHMFEAPVKDLMALITEPGSKSDTRTVIKEYFIGMMGTVVRWESPDARNNHNILWAGMPMISYAEVELRDGMNWARWQLPGPLLEAVADPTFYTPIDLGYASRLSSYSAVALYQICSRYRNNPTGLTSKNPPNWWLDAMMSTPAVDPKTKKKIVREWRKKKNAIVLDAIDEINRKTDIEISLAEFREGLPGAGRNVTAVQFSVRRKANPPVDQTPIDIELVRLYSGLGIPETLVGQYAKIHSPDLVKRALIKIEARIAREDLPAVENLSGYLGKILRESEVEVQEVAPEPRPTMKRANENAERDVPEVVSLVSPRTKVKDEFQGLDVTVRKVYAERAFSDLTEKGLATASLSRNMSQDVWAGVLLAQMVQIYGEEKYGREWESLMIPEITQFV